MPRNPSKIYRYHVENLRELEAAIGHTARLARAAIASADPEKGLRSLLRLYAFLIGAWAETRLRKLLHEEFGFTDVDRAKIESDGTQLGQWKLAVDQAFRKHHKVPKAALNARVLGVSHAARRDALHAVLDGELRIIIELRNKLAHGQWVYPFNSAGTAIETEKYRLINDENLQSLQLKFSLIGHLADAVHDLVVSPKTFQRDFDDHFRRLLQVQHNLRKKDYGKYEAMLIRSRAAARAARKSRPKAVEGCSQSDIFQLDGA